MWWEALLPSLYNFTQQNTGGAEFKMDGEGGFGKRGLPKLRELLRRPRGESEVRLHTEINFMFHIL